MRTVACLTILLLAAALAAGCDSDQPLQVGEQSLELLVTAPNTSVMAFNVWDLFEDSNNDQQPDDRPGPDVSLWCDLIFDDDGVTPTPILASSVPIHFAIKVSIRRRGETGTCVGKETRACADDQDCLGTCLNPNPAIPPSGTRCVELTDCPVEGENCIGFSGSTTSPQHCNLDQSSGQQLTITSLAALQPGSNLTPYDTNPSIPGQNPFTSPRGFSDPVVIVNDNGTERRFRFDRPRRLTIANREVIESNTNFLHDIDPATYDGVCPGLDRGIPRIDGQPQPLTFQLNQGDTVFVEARKFSDEPPELGLLNQPTLSGRLLVNGQFVNVLGSTSSSSEPGTGFSFSYTSR